MFPLFNTSLIRRLFSKRRCLRVVLYFFVGLMLLWGLSNLCLSSSWVTGMLAEKVQQRTGVPCRIDRVSWSPWNGVTVRGLEFDPSETFDSGETVRSLLVVERIQVRPYWGPLVRGQLRLREVTIDSPELNLSVEWVREALARMLDGRSLSSPAPALADSRGGGSGQDRGQGADGHADGGGTGRSARSSTDGKSQGSGGDEAKGPPPARDRSSAPSEQGKPEAGLPMLVRVNHAHLRCDWHAKGLTLFELKDVDFEISLMGEDSEGQLHIGNIRGLGLEDKKAFTKVAQKLEWKRPYLQWRMDEASLAGVQVAAHIKVLCSQDVRSLKLLPFAVDLVVKPQTLASVDGLDRMAMHLSGDRVEGRLVASGLLAQPGSWRGKMHLSGSGWRLREAHGRHDVVFDDVQIPAVYRAGTLQWGGVRLVGEDVSILGNGRVSVQQGVLSVTRLVVSPEVSEMVGRGLHGAGLARNGPAWWRNLDTPDRKVRDLLLSGSLENPLVDAGYQNQQIPVWEILGKTLAFVRQEMREEGVALQAFPSPDLDQQQPDQGD
ncbi:hypothetical protein HW115_14870 [Verrucomicrobiaceae bacterium N1E253]|uniref:Uncharacterized protein n=1 Tax=Oceaniferula marina TaxID=2748318 RepID=A0A851GRR0_9BACT|nr:hypothetical protein [Oceaniferula marina]NWK56904.1 hypothetical protein [Oceaniferula marina]